MVTRLLGRISGLPPFGGATRSSGGPAFGTRATLAGNILGVGSTIAKGIGMVVPGFSAIGAGLGVASNVANGLAKGANAYAAVKSKIPPGGLMPAAAAAAQSMPGVGGKRSADAIGGGEGGGAYTKAKFERG